MRMKTGPKLILGLIVVGALGYGINFGIDHMPKKAEVTAKTEPIREVVSEAVKEASAAESSSHPKPAPVTAPAPQDPPQDAALAKLLEAGKK